MSCTAASETVFLATSMGMYKLQPKIVASIATKGAEYLGKIGNIAGSVSSGQPTINYRTWVWDGVTAKERGCLGCLKPQAGVPNSYESLIYNLVGKECIYNKDIVGYATREECVSANCIKVHLF